MKAINAIIYEYFLGGSFSIVLSINNPDMLMILGEYSLNLFSCCALLTKNKYGITNGQYRGEGKPLNCISKVWAFGYL